MKNATRKGLTVLALAFVLVVSSLGIGSKEADAALASTHKTFYWEHGAHPSPLLHHLGTSQDNYSVYVALEQDDYCNGCQFNWTMELQRYDFGWKTIDTRTGYVIDYSPSYRTFSNIAVTGNQMRIKLSSAGQTTVYSNSFFR